MRQKKKSPNILHYLIVGIILIIPIQQSISQDIKPYTPPTPDAFFGIGIGLNDYGLGLGAEVKVMNKVWLYGIGGISTWGYRLTGGLTYYPGQDGFKSSFSLGYSYASGAKDFVTELDVKQFFSEPKEQEVTLDLLPISTINLVYSYNMKVGRKSKFVFSAGYAILLTDKLYEDKTNFSSNELTDGSKEFIKLMAPGGVIFGVKYMFGSV